MASTTVLLATLLALFLAYRVDRSVKRTLVEANNLSSGNYHIELIGDNGLALLAYKADVLHIGEQTQWDGIATVGAYKMAFQQECHSVYSPQVQAKQWRGKWVQATATTPVEQFAQWLMHIANGKGTYKFSPVNASSLLPVSEGEDKKVVTVKLRNAPLDWNALCDANIDTSFGSQAFLTDVKTGTVTLCFDALTHELFGAVISAKKGQIKITATVILSTAYGHELQAFPRAEEVSEGTLSEEWVQISPTDETAP